MLKRIGLHLKKHPRLVFEFKEEEGNEMKLRVYSDSDWVGCCATTRSRSGGTILTTGGLVKSWSNRQGIVAMSSGEAARRSTMPWSRAAPRRFERRLWRQTLFGR